MTNSDQAEKRIIPSNVWKDKGGGKGFGYVTRKVTKYVSRKRMLECNNNLTGIESTSSSGQFEI